MKEFRKEFRSNGIVPLRKNFAGEGDSWDNECQYIPYGQIIEYTLFKYQDGKFVAGNNIDKYASMYECVINSVETKKKIHQLRDNFFQKFQEEKEAGLISPDQTWTDILLRKERFPKYLLAGLENRYTDLVI